MGPVWSQTFPPSPALTERNLPDQVGKVFIVTGGASGIGFELSRILYSAGARVYIAGRSEVKAQAAIESITQSTKRSPNGELFYLPLQLDDLSTIAASVDQFRSRETKLDVLWNNAGTGPVYSSPPTAQGLDIHLATNCLGPFLFTQLLLPCLRAAGQSRVVWTTSMLVDAAAPPGGLNLGHLDHPSASDPNALYTLTKVRNWFLASEMARRVPPGSGVLGLAQNPGNLKTGVWRHQHWLMPLLLAPILHQPVFGAYTELWAGLSEEVDATNNGGLVIPWGRWHPKPRADIARALKSMDEGGDGKAEKFWDWCAKTTAPFGK